MKNNNLDQKETLEEELHNYMCLGMENGLRLTKALERNDKKAITKYRLREKMYEDICDYIQSLINTNESILSDTDNDK